MGDLIGCGGTPNPDERRILSFQMGSISLLFGSGESNQDQNGQ